MKVSLNHVLLIPIIAAAVLLLVVIFDRPAPTVERNIRGYTLCGGGGFIPMDLPEPSALPGGLNPGGPCIGSPTYGTVVIPRPSIRTKVIALSLVEGFSLLAYVVVLPKKPQKKRRS